MRGSVGQRRHGACGWSHLELSCSLIPWSALKHELYHSWSYLEARKLVFILIFKTLIVSQPLAISPWLPGARSINF